MCAITQTTTLQSGIPVRVLLQANHHTTLESGQRLSSCVVGYSYPNAVIVGEMQDAPIHSKSNFNQKPDSDLLVAGGDAPTLSF